MKNADRIIEARRWFRYAEEDLHAAEVIQGRDDVAFRHVCYLAQQAAEKAIKAVLVLKQIDFPRTHDLDMLANLIPEDVFDKSAMPDLAALTQWAVEARYPGDWPDPTADEAATAVETATVVLQAAYQVIQ